MIEGLGVGDLAVEPLAGHDANTDIVYLSGEWILTG